MEDGSGVSREKHGLHSLQLALDKYQAYPLTSV